MDQAIYITSHSILNWNYLIRNMKLNPDMRTLLVAAIKKFLAEGTHFWNLC